MAKRNKIHSAIMTLLPNADKRLVDTLAIKVKQETHGEQRKQSQQRPIRNALIQKVIVQEELIELGLRNP